VGVEELKRSMQKLHELKREFKCLWNSKAYLRLVCSGESFSCQSHLLLRVNPDGEVISPCYDVDYVTAGNLRYEKLENILRSKKYAEGCKIAMNCGKCYLLCYVEPSMIFTDLKWAARSLYEILKRI